MGTAHAAVHTRSNTGLTADAERRLLIWLAHRLPPRVGSDHLSALGLGSMMLAGLAFAAFRVNPWAGAAGVVVALVLNWFGDSLDGTVARVRGQQRPRYGYYVDHIIDLAGTAFLFGGLAASGLMHPLVAVTVLAGYLLVSAESYLATHAAGVFRMSFVGFGPTELRLVLIAGAIKAAASPMVTPFGFAEMRLFDLGGLLGCVGLLVAFLVSAARNTRDLYVAEPLPGHGRDTTVR